MTSNEHTPLLETVEAIRLANAERVAEVSSETKQDLSDRAITLMAIESAVESAS